MTLRRLLLLLPVTALVLVFGFWIWLLHTQYGANWAWSFAVSATDDAMRAERLDGTLSGGLTVHELEFTNDALSVVINEVQVAVDIDLLAKRITVEPATADGVTVRLVESEETAGATPIEEVLASLQLPVTLIVPELQVEDASVIGADGTELFLADSVSLSARWGDDIHIDRIDLRAPVVDATGSALLTLANPQQLELDTTLSLQPEFADQPIPIQVVASVYSDFVSFAVDATATITDADFRATLESEFDLETTALAGQLDWENARWPVYGPQSQVASRTGSVELAGSLDDWTVDGTLQLLVPDIAESTLTIAASGDQDAAAAEIIEGDILGGNVAGTVNYTWRDEKPFSAEVALTGIRTESLLPDWPLTLDGAVSLVGQQTPLAISVHFNDVRGDVLNRPIVADGRFEYSDDTLSFDDLNIQHGEATANFAGDPYSSDGARFDVNVDELAYYIEDAKGAFTASGGVRMDGRWPVIQIDGGGSELAYGPVTISGLSIADHASPGSNLDVEIVAHGLVIGEVATDAARLRLVVNPERQTLALDTSTVDRRATMSIEGAFDSWENPSSWSGKLNRLELFFREYSASIDSPVDVLVSKTQAELGDFVIAGTHGVSISGNGSWTEAGGGFAFAELGAVPLDVLNAYIDTGLLFDQVVTGQMEWRVGEAGEQSGRFSIAMTAGSVVSAADPEISVATGESRGGFELRGGNLSAGIVDIPLPDLGQIAANFDIAGAAADRPADIDATIDIDVADVSNLIAFFPVLDDVAGDLRIDMAIDGPVDNPAITGDFYLHEGALAYLPIGLNLREIELDSELRGDGEFELGGSFRAGDGLATIRTRRGQTPGMTTGIDFSITGENLLIIDVPDVRAVADADLQLGFDGKVLTIDGELTVPSALIKPTRFGASVVRESEDVVIIAGELPDEPTVDGDAGGIQIEGNLVASLGDDVVIRFDRAETTLSGSTAFAWSGDPVPMADGGFNIEGEILAYGQRLEVTEGRIRFPNVPADDPLVRLRAEREIFGNTEVRRAGILLTGQLRRPDIETYTEPMTTEERALTLLVTGSDFDYEQGVGSVDFGVYIAPRVFVSYGIGLFDSENVVRIRYDLKQGWGVTGTSGQRDSGLDLSYRFEN